MKCKLIILFKTVFLSFLLFSECFSQTQFETIKKAGYNYLSIVDTIKNTCNDSIRFIISDYKNNKPTILFIQGSMPDPLIYNENNKSFCFFNSLVDSSIIKKYNIVLIAKPGIPICAEFGKFSWSGLTEKEQTIFNKCNYKNYYVNTIKKVIDFLIKKEFINSNNLYIVGHSQGYEIAAKLVALYPNKIKKVVCLSANPFNIPIIEINKIREKANYGVITQENAKQEIDSIYSNFNYIISKQNDINDKNYLYIKKDYSFWSELSIEYLLKINIPILVAYGMQDPASLDNDKLPIFFKIKNKNNLTLLSYPNLDHNFFMRQYDDKGKIIKEEFNWNKIFNDIDKWLTN